MPTPLFPAVVCTVCKTPNFNNAENPECDGCRLATNEYKKAVRHARYKELDEAGLCRKCKKEPRCGETTTCEKCRQENNDRLRQFKRDQFAEREAAGLCVKCAEPKDGVEKHCSKCLADRRGQTAKTKAKGLCLGCRENKPSPNYTYCRRCLDSYSPKNAERNQRLKIQVMLAYGGPKCTCCGVDNLDVLTVDHINDDGAAHRRQIEEKTSGRGTGGKMYRVLRDTGYPPGFQVLCFNCNYAKYRLGRQPTISDVYGTAQVAQHCSTFRVNVGGETYEPFVYAI